MASQTPAVLYYLGSLKCLRCLIQEQLNSNKFGRGKTQLNFIMHAKKFLEIRDRDFYYTATLQLKLEDAATLVKSQRVRNTWSDHGCNQTPSFPIHLKMYQN